MICAALISIDPSCDLGAVTDDVAEGISGAPLIDTALSLDFVDLGPDPGDFDLGGRPRFLGGDVEDEADLGGRPRFFPVVDGVVGDFDDFLGGRPRGRPGRFFSVVAVSFAALRFDERVGLGVFLLAPLVPIRVADLPTFFSLDDEQVGQNHLVVFGTELSGGSRQ